MRTYLAFALCLALVLTTQTMALARGAAGPAGAVELCTGSGPVIVLVDENGEPTGRAHICPECLAHALTAVLPPDMPVFTATFSRLSQFPLTPVLGLTITRDTPRARAPPILI